MEETASEYLFQTKNKTTNNNKQTLN